MKSFALLLTACCLFFSSVNAQTLNGVESVEYDPVNNKWLCATGSLIHMDLHGGNLTTFAANGGSHGTDVLDGKVYSCSGSTIKGYDLTSGAQVLTVSIAGAVFLNGLTSNGVDLLYATDFQTDKIYTIDVNAQTYSTLLSTPTQPNGVKFDADNNRLVYVSWGGNAKIYGISLVDTAVTVLLSTSLANLDGIEKDNNGSWFVTSYSAGRLYEIPNDFSSAPVQVMSGFSSPADIGFNPNSDTIAIPNSGSVDFYYSEDTTTIVTPPIGIDPIAQHAVSGVWPNPVLPGAAIHFRAPFGERMQVTVIDLRGQLVRQETIQSVKGTNSWLPNPVSLDAGIYFLKLEGLESGWSNLERLLVVE